ncbi:SEC-C motif-containing protein [Actinocrispum wychmicini]|uniref:SEC-C motif-containing protein n=1 Tax=Actinocrispum wychmicini TaxID=1213861 RepID=A0A4R2JAJ8_9PSEU|nr:SEC-C motif-containing protein [Actinocrispum wychmicini]
MFHRGDGTAGTAETLMRSRFSAFAVGNEAYLLQTWHPRTRPASVPFDPGLTWTSLEIVGKSGGGPFHQEGTVEFRAHYRAAGRGDSMHENSRFERVGGDWVYVSPEASS